MRSYTIRVLGGMDIYPTKFCTNKKRGFSECWGYVITMYRITIIILQFNKSPYSSSNRHH
jgi:hypothetical protein